jgi:tryptophanyl-tRNA synthetase
MNNDNKKIVFSGVKPSGNLHIGNYLGAIKRWVDTQNEYYNIFCIVDLHAITVRQDPKELNNRIKEIAAVYLAAGIDPDKSIVFVQSHVPAHTELAWILNCLTPFGWMRRMTQFKEKAQKEGEEQSSVGLFSYPVLMAADILLYNTDFVPVGEDQKQHLEYTRNIAQRFNSIYGQTFKLPSPLIAEIGARIMGLDDPEKKMSKSDKGKYRAINLLDSPSVILEKIKRAATDSQNEIIFDKNRKAIYNLLTIYKLFSGLNEKEIENRFSNKGYAEFKQDLANLIIDKLSILQHNYKNIISDQAKLDQVLSNGAQKVNLLANKMLQTVKEKIGLGL